LPVGRWVHLAGTFDGQTMRIYVDGVPRGSLERPGPVNAAARTPLVLGSYAADFSPGPPEQIGIAATGETQGLDGPKRRYGIVMPVL